MLTDKALRYKRFVSPDLDSWLKDPALRVFHWRESDARPDDLWAAATRVRIAETGLLGRLIRWRIPGTTPHITFDELFRREPFIVLDGAGPHALVSGIVGRIWTLRRDYPSLSNAQEFRDWSVTGTARVLFANWVEQPDSGRARLVSEARVDPIGARGRIGVAAVRPLVARFQNSIGSDGLETAVRRAERSL